MPQLLPQIADALKRIEAALPDHVQLAARPIDYGARFEYNGPDDSAAAATLYSSPKQRRFSLAGVKGHAELTELLTDLVEAHCAVHVAAPPPSSEPRTEAPVSGIAEVDAFLVAALPRLHAAGLFPVDMDPIPYGLKLSFADGKARVVVSVYHSKKKGLSIVPGQGPAAAQAEQVAAIMRGATAPPLPAGEATLRSWIGTDEAGKGDYFGPLVTAGVRADRESAEALVSLGATDSKRLNVQQVERLAGAIRRELRGQYAVVPIGPRRYNELYEQNQGRGRGLNGLLAWSHGRVVRDLADRGADYEAVVVDRFASQRVIADAMPRGTNVLARPRAEDNPAVAAASILARATYLSQLADLSERFGVELGSGAGPAIIESGRALVERHGADVLHDVAKVHFRTTSSIL
jgi:ribonuclease HIII